MTRAHLAIAAACMLFTAGCGEESGGSSSGGELIGAGSTFVYPLVAKWISNYSKTHRVRITYGPIGSGGGIQQLTNRTIDFGASDAPMTPDQANACKGCMQLPWALAGTSIAYNVPGAPRHLKLTGKLLADIFLGKVTSWNNTAISKLNPGTELPALRITPIFRRDSSGTTYNLTDYLARVSAEWKTKVGTGPSVRFPAGAGANGSSGVAAALSRAKGGITYIDAAYSIANGFDYAALGNRAGSFELPDSRAVSAAAGAVASVPHDNAVSLVDPPASATGAYPLATFSYALVPGRSAKAAALKPFLRYAIGPGQRFAPPLQFAVLPPAILDAGQRTIARIKQR